MTAQIKVEEINKTMAHVKKYNLLIVVEKKNKLKHRSQAWLSG